MCIKICIALVFLQMRPKWPGSRFAGLVLLLAIKIIEFGTNPNPQVPDMQY